TGCPEDFFQIEGSAQCFQFFNDTVRDWSGAHAKCLELNQTSTLATPSEEAALSLRKHLLHEYGEGDVWLDGISPGGSVPVMVQGNQTELNSDHHLWVGGWPRLSSDEDECLVMVVYPEWLSKAPAQVYFHLPCTTYEFTLCEAVFD
ncbi:unnamed protein product, partial [Meganyctiphanes norvegica]